MYLAPCDQQRQALSDTQSLVDDRNKAIKQLGLCAAQVDGLRGSRDAHRQSVGK